WFCLLTECLIIGSVRCSSYYSDRTNGNKSNKKYIPTLNKSDCKNKLNFIKRYKKCLVIYSK
ncbi:hypothetical protein BD770DRAFT_404958, partial [Pilaira anomala]